MTDHKTQVRCVFSPLVPAFARCGHVLTMRGLLSRPWHRHIYFGYLFPDGLRTPCHGSCYHHKRIIFVTDLHSPTAKLRTTNKGSLAVCMGLHNTGVIPLLPTPNPPSTSQPPRLVSHDYILSVDGPLVLYPSPNHRTKETNKQLPHPEPRNTAQKFKRPIPPS